jgi:hypothetical protein
MRKREDCIPELVAYSAFALFMPVSYKDCVWATAHNLTAVLNRLIEEGMNCFPLLTFVMHSLWTKFIEYCGTSKSLPWMSSLECRVTHTLYCVSFIFLVCGLSSAATSHLATFSLFCHLSCPSVVGGGSRSLFNRSLNFFTVSLIVDN